MITGMNIEFILELDLDNWTEGFIKREEALQN
ncbi:hypothetical protein Desor_1884 [Desulfosporosinus orientis DSM 765]|uniref:Uncharacterized protein n=1 Tax=Desulfosporosinus orientis (strain ATCC 19365 / DSM 765 / NCIMB 8382 / VKM B-1628 / Singapore I) TaxID=768706 RepID=G7WB14_DESOD|nr:hypothetical protein Desor_1884 [Desulfosporosinus orientis DSM 765]